MGIKEEKYGYIDAIYVKEEERGKGMGRELLKMAEEFLASQGIKWVELDIYERNVQSVGFYEKMGFKILSRRMRKHLTS